MAKEVTNVERESVQSHKFALEREQVCLECDDGSEYIFERAADAPHNELTLVRRVDPDGETSTSKAILPSSVKESMDRLTERLASLGIERDWSK